MQREAVETGARLRRNPKTRRVERVPDEDVSYIVEEQSKSPDVEQRALAAEPEAPDTGAAIGDRPGK